MWLTASAAAIERECWRYRNGASGGASGSKRPRATVMRGELIQPKARRQSLLLKILISTRHCPLARPMMPQHAAGR